MHQPNPQPMIPVASVNSPSGSNHPLQGFYQHQQEVLRTHQQYLAQQLEYARAFWQVLQQLHQNNSGSMTDLPEGIQRQLQWFHQHQQETLRVHEQYMKSQADQSHLALHWSFQGGSPSATPLPAPPALDSQTLAPPAAPDWQAPTVQLPSPSIPTPPTPRVNPTPPTPAVAVAPSVPATPPVPTQAPVESSPTSSALPIDQLLLAIVAEKTGYPADMLELSMDMEADLGIDSIKRVEILGALQEQQPNLPVQADDLAEKRTLAQIVEVLAPTAGNDITTAEAPKPNGDDSLNLADILLSIVAEKTGYPADMLELSMDMEADLGIDSIKRVEILGALQEQQPNLPVQADDLAEKRTLAQIVEVLAPASAKKNS